MVFSLGFDLTSLFAVLELKSCTITVHLLRYHLAYLRALFWGRTYSQPSWAQFAFLTTSVRFLPFNTLMTSPSLRTFVMTLAISPSPILRIKSAMLACDSILLSVKKCLSTVPMSIRLLLIPVWMSSMLTP